jgi:MFS family permease
MTATTEIPNDRRRWLALLLVCAAQLMIVLDGTIVNVALPAIQDSLGFSQAGLSWVVNAYLLTFGGFLLLGGRAGDLFGRRRVFAFGLALFTLASLLCGLAGSQGLLVAARALQGVGGAIIAPAALSLIITSFKDPGERARAMGVWAFVVSGGASVGVLLGGVLTQTLSWSWIFLVNIPVGLAALALCRPLLAPDPKPDTSGGFDLPRALLVTSSLVAAVYAIVGAAYNPPAVTALLLLVAAALMVAFAAVERRTKAPLVPPGIFASSRNLTVSNVVMALAVVGMVAWFFFSALYLQRVLGYDSLATGLAYLPTTAALGAISQGPAARAVNRLGIKPTILGGDGPDGRRAPVLRAGAGRGELPPGRPARDARPRGGGGVRVHGGDPGRNRRRPRGRGGTCIRPREHLPADGRCSGPRGTRRRRGCLHGESRRFPARRPQLRLPRSLPRGRGLRCPRRPHRRHPAPSAHRQGRRPGMIQRAASQDRARRCRGRRTKKDEDARPSR